MGQAKKELEKQREKEENQKQYLINYKGYIRCPRCENVVFLPKNEGETLCKNCQEAIDKL